MHENASSRVHAAIFLFSTTNEDLKCYVCVIHNSSSAGVLQDVSTRGDTESRSGLAEVVSEISLALARRSTDWVASASELEHFSNRNAERAEATFSQYSVELRTKVGRGSRTDDL